MGLSPSELGKMSLWRFGARVKAWNEINKAANPKPNPDDMPEDIFEKIGIVETWQEQTSKR
jgi:hypothetical protein